MSPIYLDYSSTTPCDPKVVEGMMPYFQTNFGNASSAHHIFGWQAAKAVDIARMQLAELINSDEKEIYFTSGATESLNLILKGVTALYQTKGNHIITCQTEHSAVLDTCEYLEKKNVKVSYLSVDHNGAIDLEQLKSAISNDTIMVCMMYTNNETGVIHPIHEIGKICKDRNILFCVDATQAVGKIDIDPKIDHIDFLVWSAHKMYGPKGVGALYFNTKKRIKIDPLLHGGGHEKKLRAGTLNVPAIVGFGIAAALSKDRMHQDADKILALRDYFEKSISKLPSVSINGVNSPRQYNISNVWFRYTENELLLSHLHHRLAVSTGSACSSASDDPSHVLTAMGLTPYQAKSCLRFSLGRYTTKEQIDQAIALVIERVEAVRQESPKWQMHEQGYDLADF